MTSPERLPDGQPGDECEECRASIIGGDLICPQCGFIQQGWRANTDARLPNGWTLCAGCPVRDGKRSVMQEIQMLLNGRDHIGFAHTLERIQEAVDSVGRPDTAEGELRTKVGEITERMAHKFWNHRTTAEDGLDFARELRAALRVGGAQK